MFVVFDCDIRHTLCAMNENIAAVNYKVRLFSSRVYVCNEMLMGIMRSKLNGKNNNK